MENQETVQQRTQSARKTLLSVTVKLKFKVPSGPHCRRVCNLVARRAYCVVTPKMFVREMLSVCRRPTSPTRKRTFAKKSQNTLAKRFGAMSHRSLPGPKNPPLQE